jgi:hypothetical protein
MNRTRCPSCRQTIGQVTLLPYDDDLEPVDVNVDPVPSLHGRVAIVDVALGLAVLEPRAPGLYRLHSETCRRRP